MSGDFCFCSVSIQIICQGHGEMKIGWAFCTQISLSLRFIYLELTTAMFRINICSNPICKISQGLRHLSILSGVLSSARKMDRELWATFQVANLFQLRVFDLRTTTDVGMAREMYSSSLHQTQSFSAWFKLCPVKWLWTRPRLLVSYLDLEVAAA